MGQILWLVFHALSGRSVTVRARDEREACEAAGWPRHECVARPA